MAHPTPRRKGNDLQSFLLDLKKKFPKECRVITEKLKLDGFGAKPSNLKLEVLIGDCSKGSFSWWRFIGQAVHPVSPCNVTLPLQMGMKMFLVVVPPQR